MDILYIVGKQSGNGNRELRWSLRGVEKYGVNVGRVIVAGYPPPWLSKDVEKVHFRQTAKRKQQKLIDTIFAVIDEEIVAGEFLFSCDDFFYSAPFDFDACPFWMRREEIRTEAEMLRTFYIPQNRVSNSWWRSVFASREALVQGGYPVVECCCHCVSRFDTADAEAVRKVMADYHGHYRDYSFEQTLLFQNVRAAREAIEWTRREDIKLERFDAERIRTGLFSCGDAAFRDPEFTAYMAREFGKKSRYESEDMV